VIAWRRATLANARRNLVIPATISLLVLVGLLGAGVGGSWRALAMFTCAAFVLGSVGQEFWRGVRVRRSLSHESPPVALVTLVQRNRRRFGGYIVHVGIAILFVGVAASSSFQHESELGLNVGQSAQVGPYMVRYVAPTATVLPNFDHSHTGSILDLGAKMDVTRGGRHVATLYPSAGYYTGSDPSQGSVGSLISGETVSHVGLNAGPLRDYWAAIQPDISAPELQNIINAGNKVIPFSRPDEALVAIALVARRYLASPPEAQFHILVSPLVTWIWSGGIIVFLGALVAMWPAPRLVRRSVRVSARAMRGLARA
jgi:cytochrome c-type biogenesis protein CcmF